MKLNPFPKFFFTIPLHVYFVNAIVSHDHLEQYMVNFIPMYLGYNY